MNKGSFQWSTMHNGGGWGPASPSIMKIISWNCKWPGNPRAGAVLSHLVKGKAPMVLFQMETRQTVDEMRNIRADLWYDNMLSIPYVRRAGGLAMLWKDEVRLDVQTFSLNHIDAHILADQNSPWRLIGFYGKLEEQRKHESWGLWNIYTLEIQCRGYVLETTMKF